MQSKNFFSLSKFSHIYVEKAAKGLSFTNEILEKLPKANIIEIDRYQEVFNRTRQNWREAKSSQKLILAVKKDGFLHKASDVIQNNEVERFFYTTPILNCVYDCDYCFLQGMFTSPHAVIFINHDDFFNDTDRELALGELYLSPSYETDLLSFESIVPWSRKWIEFAQTRPKLTVEIRTKSVSYRSISDLTVSPNVILSWTISPNEIAQKYEKGVPSLDSRLASAKMAIKDGWKVRLCFDPILAVNDWQSIYSNFLNKLSSEFPISKLFDVWVGTFRMSSEFLKNIRNSRDDSDILFYPFENSEGVASYSKSIRQQALTLTHDVFIKHLPKEKIVNWG